MHLIGLVKGTLENFGSRHHVIFPEDDLHSSKSNSPHSGMMGVVPNILAQDIITQEVAFIAMLIYSIQ